MSKLVLLVVHNFRPTTLIKNTWNEFIADFGRLDLAQIQSNNTSHRLDLFFPAADNDDEELKYRIVPSYIAGRN